MALIIHNEGTFTGPSTNPGLAPVHANSERQQYGSDDVTDLYIELTSDCIVPPEVHLAVQAFTDGVITAEMAIGYLLLYDAMEQSVELNNRERGIYEW